ncbi:MAG: hypothetical protein NWE91_01900 [Candidatus Bathyarchaeota archaeon]|nr:hypothetical protein [Candidatus Bathyarchaeota archaeon]
MKSHENWSIKKWSEMFSELYSQADSKRTPEQMWIAVMAHTSFIGENIRKIAFESLLNSAAHTFCWLCSFVNKCNKFQDDIFSIDENLSEIVSLKYPRVCGHCGASTCSCDPEKMDKEENKSALYKDLFNRRKEILASVKNYSIKTWKGIFRRIYSGRIHIQTLESIGFHFLEEVGEAAFCIRKLGQLRKVTEYPKTEIDLDFLNELSTVKGIVEKYDDLEKLIRKLDYSSTEANMVKARVVEAKMGLIVEIGDSFSWFCAILNKLNSISKAIFDKPEEHQEFPKLDQVLTNEYFDTDNNPRCPHCKSKPCECTFYIDTDKSRSANAKRK